MKTVEKTVLLVPPGYKGRTLKDPAADEIRYDDTVDTPTMTRETYAQVPDKFEKETDAKDLDEILTRFDNAMGGESMNVKEALESLHDLVHEVVEHEDVGISDEKRQEMRRP